MPFIAERHLHFTYSRATRHELEVESSADRGRNKDIALLGITEVTPFGCSVKTRCRIPVISCQTPCDPRLMPGRRGARVLARSRRVIPSRQPSMGTWIAPSSRDGTLHSFGPLPAELGFFVPPRVLEAIRRVRQGRLAIGPARDRADGTIKICGDEPQEVMSLLHGTQAQLF
jgi:hypothetical protein